MKNGAEKCTFANDKRQSQWQFAQAIECMGMKRFSIDRTEIESQFQQQKQQI